MTWMLRQVRTLDATDSEARRFERLSNQESKVHFWYSKDTAAVFLIALILAVISISNLTPPFSSPDEFNHVKRAYLLSRGHVFLETGGSETGGNIDSGLLAYMDLFDTLAFTYREKVTQKIWRDSKRISWSGQEAFSGLPNTAVYFPLSYIPQATAFFVGQHTALSINDTYYLARALSLLATITMLSAALALYPVPLPVLALFGLPMVLFQLGSASLDAVSLSMCVLAGSLFMRAADLRFCFSPLMHFALISCLLLLSTSRTNLVGLIWLPAVLHSLRNSRSYLISTGILVSLSASWVIFATLTVKGTQIQEISSVGILSYYLTHPYYFFSVVASTVTNGAILLGYWNMFVGILGWLDTPLDSSVYSAFAALLVAVSIVSIQTDRTVLLELPRMSLAVGTLLSTMLIFVLFLATYTLHPATVVEVIQGRYLYPSAIFIGFVLFDRCMSVNRRRIGICVLLFLIALSVVSMAPKMISRYWAS